VSERSRAERSAVTIRPFERTDTSQLIALMRQLPQFEGDVDAFRVTEADLVRGGLGSTPRFGTFVASEADATLVGMAVHYTVPWTYDLRPTLVLKELCVVVRARGRGIGHRLMAAVAREAVRIGAPRLAWLVLPENHEARVFYVGLGGHPDAKWEPWVMEEQPLRRLARQFE
jgi:GNAT superfamily N-acetyltransferase